MMAKALLTYADYAALPDDGKRYEILDGELFVTPSPSSQHQIILANLVEVLGGYVRQHRIGKVLFAPLDVIFADSSIAQPDAIYLDAASMPLISRRGIEGGPPLVVEVLSPSTTRTDRSVKFSLYARYGVEFYWIVDPDARVLEAYRRAGEGYVLAMTASGTKPCGPPPFEDLGLIVDDLWS
jgi:Uma2 family endonuclease